MARYARASLSQVPALPGSRSADEAKAPVAARGFSASIALSPSASQPFASLPLGGQERSKEKADNQQHSTSSALRGGVNNKLLEWHQKWGRRKAENPAKRGLL